VLIYIGGRIGERRFALPKAQGAQAMKAELDARSVKGDADIAKDTR
jgi:hypothetical protein